VNNPTPSRASKARATFFGLAIGDALGTTVEFQPRGSFPLVTDMVGGGVFNLPPGGWTDDTSMALALATSLAEHGEFDPHDVMDRFVAWYLDGEYSHTYTCFDIGRTTANALNAYQDMPETPWHGQTGPYSAGNGGIMRVAPVFLLYADDPVRGREVAVAQSQLTHGDPQCDEAAETLAAVVYELFDGTVPAAITSRESVPEDRIKSGGYVVDTLDAALWSIANSDSFATAMLTAVNLGHDADTVGAVTGILAGARYGMEGIPESWKQRVLWSEQIDALATRLLQTVA
jgi:ADP-ribosyl-[dinitrogen reductase] hydrolase